MFIRASTLLLPILALPSVVAAAPEPIAARDDSSCDYGTLQCCSSIYPVSYHTLLLQERTVNHSPVHLQATQSILDMFIIIGNRTIPLIGPLLAINCSPITTVGVGTDANCAAGHTVCCQSIQFVSPPCEAEVEVPLDLFSQSFVINVGCRIVDPGL